VTRTCNPFAWVGIATCCTLLGLAFGGACGAHAQDFSEFSRARDAARVKQGAARTTRAVSPRAWRNRASSGRSVLARAVPSGAGRLASARAAPQAPLPEAPLLLVVSLDHQRLSIYSKGKLAETTTVSTGTPSDPTPSGVFAIIEKSERHFSNLFGGAPMPFMQRLTMSGVALHSGHVTGRVASHGCIRLPHEYARRLYKATELGMRVVVSADDPVPVDIPNMRLLEPARLAAATKIAMASTVEATSASDGTPVQPAPAIRDKSIDPRTGKQKGPLSLLRDEVLRAAPLSVLVSRAEGRVYVRHMFEPQLDAAAEISEPRRPLGTHVYTLIETQPDGSGQRWSAVTVKLVPRRTAIRVLQGQRSRAARSAEPSGSALPDEGTPSTAVEAIERFSLPPEIVAQIAPVLRPGTSIVVTDLPPSKRIRTGWTDIMVTP